MFPGSLRKALWVASTKSRDIYRRHHWFSREITSEEEAQKFHTDDASLPGLESISDWLKQISNLL